MTLAPTGTEPVKVTWSTPGWRASRSPTTDPEPLTMLTTPSGTPTSFDLREVVKRDRSLGGGFDDNRAARGQCRRDTANGDLQGVVPRHDLCAHADRFPDRPVHHARSEWNRGALEFVTHSCIEFEEPGGAVHFPVSVT